MPKSRLNSSTTRQLDEAVIPPSGSTPIASTPGQPGGHSSDNFSMEMSGAEFVPTEAHVLGLSSLRRNWTRGDLSSYRLGTVIDVHVHGVLRRDAALFAVEDLVFTNLRRAGLVLDPRRGILHLDVGKGVRAALVADEQRVALREVAGVGRALQDFHQAPIAVLAVAGGDAL